MDDQAVAPTPRWSALTTAAVKGGLVAVLLAGCFLVLPGNWNWRITLAVAAFFGLNTFVFSLFGSWAAKKVQAHLSK